MKFLLFNFAVVAALIYIFGVEHKGFGLGGEEDSLALESLRQKVETLTQELAEDREVAEAKTASEKAAAASAPEKTLASEESPAQAAQSTAPKPAPAQPEVFAPKPAPPKPVTKLAEAKPEPRPVTAKAPAKSPQTQNAKPQSSKKSGPIPLTAKSLPPVADPAVAKRRAKVLEGSTAAELGGTANGAAVAAAAAAGEPMSPEERVRKLYSLAEEMELLYVKQLAR